jgi:hypothetical protein
MVRSALVVLFLQRTDILLPDEPVRSFGCAESLEARSHLGGEEKT